MIDQDHITGGFKYLKCPWCDTHFKSNTKGKLGNHISMQHGIQKLNDKWICPGMIIIRRKECRYKKLSLYV